MAEYYRDPYGKTGTANPEQRSAAIWLTALDIFMAVVSALSALMLTVIFTSQFVSPDKMWYFSLLGLLAPIVYIIALVAMFYWIIRWKWIPTVIMLLFILTGLFYVPLYCKIDITRTYGDPVYDRGNVKILTFNVRHFLDDRWHSSADSVAALVKTQQPDIICFQEYPGGGAIRKRMESLLEGYQPSGMSTRKKDLAVECFSRNGIIKTDSITGLNGTALGMWADVRMADDTVRVFNIHLQITSVSPKDNQYITHHQFLADSTRKQRFHDIARGLLANNRRRAQQVNLIRSEIEQSPYPVVVCGDFNDVPMSYAYRTVAKGLDDTFRKQGHGYAHTYRGLFDMLRIDYILVDPHRFETLSYEIPQLEVSDHYPVVSRIKLTDNKL